MSGRIILVQLDRLAELALTFRAVPMVEQVDEPKGRVRLRQVRIQLDCFARGFFGKRHCFTWRHVSRGERAVTAGDPGIGGSKIWAPCDGLLVFIDSGAKTGFRSLTEMKPPEKIV